VSVIVADSIGLQHVIVGVDTDMHGVDARPVYMQAAYDSKMQAACRLPVFLVGPRLKVTIF